ncbi:hypothetical protein EDB84DRAFT_520197 [Lactarius hengduanensis]|nr:hypothetical protein EDB84DRAFT_520197 [Lactarius hengduanensis]
MAAAASHCALMSAFLVMSPLVSIIFPVVLDRPPFECEDFTIGGERLSFYFRNVLQCIRTFFGDPEFTHELAFAPERHYSDPERTCRVYSEMHTGDWWWAVQVCILSQTNLNTYTSR